MFRLPSLSDLLGLFWRSKTVAGAVYEIERASTRLDQAVKHHIDQASQAEARRQRMIAEAAGHAAARDTHQADAQKAARIGDRLTELLA
jgi:hypothetical protein